MKFIAQLINKEYQTLNFIFEVMSSYSCFCLVGHFLTDEQNFAVTGTQKVQNKEMDQKIKQYSNNQCDLLVK
jgi:hypothetical protein